MYFDPLTTWVVSLLANGTVLSGEYVSDAKVTQYYKNKVKESNANLNAELRRRLSNRSSLPDFQMREIRILLKYYQNRFEYRYGAVELAPDVQELMIKIFRKYVSEHSGILQKCEEIYNKKLTTGQDVSYVKRCISEEKTELAFCNQVLSAVEEQLRLKKQREGEKQKAQEIETLTSGKFGMFPLLFIGVLILMLLVYISK